MEVCNYIEALVEYGIEKSLILPEDRVFTRNRMLSVLGISEFASEKSGSRSCTGLAELLEKLCDYTVLKGQIEDTIIARDLLDTAIMGTLTAAPSSIAASFSDLYLENPIAATDWFYEHAQDVNYIRRDRIEKDVQWRTPTEYGEMQITINLSKPEKDPRDIAKAKQMPPSVYPKCLLCSENEGYAGNAAHPARQNLRLIPLKIAGGNWAMQYSPYVYYNEHCIVLNREHIPMVIDASVFDKLLDFVEIFPHYFVGSNADLPIVGGSILSHEHFQGGRYSFPLQESPVEESFEAKDFSGGIGIVKWPMSVIRISHPDRKKLSAYATKILCAWRKYSDSEAFIFAETDGTAHNTITPIARKNGESYELDLVLRNNITTKEHPMGLYHPHAELHNIKKENIGLIEVMGLAVLPGRLKGEMQALAEAIINCEDISQNPEIEKHQAWIMPRLSKYENICPESLPQILQTEIGLTFKTVLEHAGVFGRDKTGRAAFRRFVESVL